MNRSRVAASTDLRVLLLALLGAASCDSHCLAQAPAAVVECRSSWQAFLEGEFVNLTFAARNCDPKAARLRWSFTVGTETVMSGHRPLAVRPGTGCTSTIALQMPRLQGEAATSGSVHVALVGLRDETEVATFEKPIWVFAESPFEGRLEWLERLDIALFDPAETTACELDALGVPYEPLSSVDEITDEAASRGVLIVGEGASFADEEGLAEALLTVASLGRPVLVLAPTGGSLRVPGLGRVSEPQPRRVSFRRGEAISSLDPRLDANQWPGCDEIVLGGFQLQTKPQTLTAEFGEQEQRWPWLDVEYSARGRLIVCGFGVMREWDQGATPRHLFARLLEVLAEEPADAIPSR